MYLLKKTIKNISSSVKFLYKKLIGLYIKFLYLCISSSLFLNLLLFLCILPWVDLNAVTGPIALLSQDMFLSLLVLSQAVKFDNVRIFLSDASGIAEAGLLETFTLRNSMKVGGIIIAGAGIARADDYLHSSRRMNDFYSYTNHMKHLNEPLDQSLIKDILTEKSSLTKFTENLPKVFGKKDFSFEDLKNNGNTKL